MLKVSLSMLFVKSTAQGGTCTGSPVNGCDGEDSFSVAQLPGPPMVILGSVAPSAKAALAPIKSRQAGSKNLRMRMMTHLAMRCLRARHGPYWEYFQDQISANLISALV